MLCVDRIKFKHKIKQSLYILYHIALYGANSFVTQQQSKGLSKGYL